MYNNNPLTFKFKSILIFSVLFGLVTISFFGLSVPVESAVLTTNPEVCLIPNARTQWENSCSLEKFDSSLGQLLSVQLSLTVSILTDAQLENLDAQPIDVTITRGARVRLQRPDNTELLSFVPSIVNSEQFSGYDGVTDYAGTSGATYPQESRTEVQNQSYLPGNADFTLFQGAGAGEIIVFPVLADSILNYSELAANFASVVNTFASAQVSVIYQYEVADPTPIAIIDPTLNTRTSRLPRTGGSDN